MSDETITNMSDETMFVTIFMWKTGRVVCMVFHTIQKA